MTTTVAAPVLTIPATMLTLLCDMALHAALVDKDPNHRPTLQGAHLKVDAQEVKIATCDGFRMAVARYSHEQECIAPFAAILNIKALRFYMREVADERKREKYGPDYLDRLAPNADHSAVCITSGTPEGDFCASIPTIDRVYPDVEQLIPKKHTTTVTATCAAMLAALDFIKPVARAADHGMMQLAVDPGAAYKAQLSASVRFPAEASASAAVEMARAEGKALTIACEHRFLVDAYKGVAALSKQSTPELRLQGPNDPLVLRDAGSRWSFETVVMPMHLATNHY